MVSWLGDALHLPTNCSFWFGECLALAYFETTRLHLKGICLQVRYGSFSEVLSSLHSYPGSQTGYTTTTAPNAVINDRYY